MKEKKKRKKEMKKNTYSKYNAREEQTKMET